MAGLRRHRLEASLPARDLDGWIAGAVVERDQLFRFGDAEVRACLIALHLETITSRWTTDTDIEQLLLLRPEQVTGRDDH